MVGLCADHCAGKGRTENEGNDRGPGGSGWHTLGLPGAQEDLLEAVPSPANASRQGGRPFLYSLRRPGASGSLASVSGTRSYLGLVRLCLLAAGVCRQPKDCPGHDQRRHALDQLGKGSRAGNPGGEISTETQLLSEPGGRPLLLEILVLIASL